MTAKNRKQENLRGIVKESIKDLLNVYEKSPDMFHNEREVQCYLYSILKEKKFEGKKLGKVQGNYPVSYVHAESRSEVSYKKGKTKYKPVDISVCYPEYLLNKKEKPIIPRDEWTSKDYADKWREYHPWLSKEYHDIEIKRVFTLKLGDGKNSIRYDIDKLNEIKKQNERLNKKLHLRSKNWFGYMVVLQIPKKKKSSSKNNNENIKKIKKYASERGVTFCHS